MLTFRPPLPTFPVELRGRVPRACLIRRGSCWTIAYHIVGHLEFYRDVRHKSPPWPEGYWPKKAEPANEEAWDKSVDSIKRTSQTCAS